MGAAHFSKMQDADREDLAHKLCDILLCLGDFLDPLDVNPQFGSWAQLVIASVYTSAFCGHYNKKKLFTENPTLDGLGDVEALIYRFDALRDLFGYDTAKQISRGVLRLWMEYLLENIGDDKDATHQRVNECRFMLAREIVRRVCDGAVAAEREWI